MNTSRLVDAICASLLFAVSANSQAAIYHIDLFEQYNGSNTYTDTFSDGLEPPSGSVSSTDYIVFGTFGSDRENGGLLELNTDDGAQQDGDTELVAALDDPGNGEYLFTSGSGGYVFADLQVNNGFEMNSAFGIGIDNFQIPDPVSSTESVGMGIFAEGGSIFAGYGHIVGDTTIFDTSIDITSAFGSNTLLTMLLSIDSATDNVTACFDYGSDGSCDLTANDFTTLQFIDGRYTGSFQADITTVPVLPAIWLFGSGLLGLLGISRNQKAA